MTHFDPDALLADARRKQRRAHEIAERARARLGIDTAPRSPTYLTDGLTAEEIERDTASIYKVMDIWRRIGKTTPSPITLPSGKTIVPKATTEGRGRIEYAVPRRRRQKGARA
jgi:hypothetical protein